MTHSPSLQSMQASGERPMSEVLCAAFVSKCDASFPEISPEVRKEVLLSAREACAREWEATYPDHLQDGDFSQTVRLGLHDDMSMVMVAFRAILAERERHGWKPISQVNPVDGLIVVGYGEYRERDGFSPAFMRWYDSVAGWSVNGMPFYPTHFKPLPSPPKP